MRALCSNATHSQEPVGHHAQNHDQAARRVFLLPKWLRCANGSIRTGMSQRSLDAIGARDLVDICPDLNKDAEAEAFKRRFDNARRASRSRTSYFPKHRDRRCFFGSNAGRWTWLKPWNRSAGGG